jgi:hypothetical protein
MLAAGIGAGPGVLMGIKLALGIVRRISGPPLVKGGEIDKESPGPEGSDSEFLIEVRP